MSSMLQKLIGKAVSEYAEAGDSVGFVFDSGDKLAIYNSYECTTESYDELLGKKICSIQEFENKIVINFEKEIGLNILLDDESWNTPEALEAVFSDGEIMVWT